jgi:hypothetical protein
MDLILFLFNVVAISLSGVMAPGPVTAATLTCGARSRWAGSWIAIGHGMLEIPLIFLIMIGLAPYLKADTFKIVVGLVGGIFLMWMAYGMIRQARHPNPLAAAPSTTGPIATGFLLSASSPYFLFWWASTGLIHRPGPGTRLAGVRPVCPGPLALRPGLADRPVPDRLSRPTVPQRPQPADHPLRLRRRHGVVRRPFSIRRLSSGDRVK